MQGRLIYVMGPSGSGKDAVLQGLIARGGDYHLARRIVTRPVEAYEAHALSVSFEEFCHLKQRGALAMAWRANGLAYGIPREIDAILDAGHDVLVNGSRAYLPQARARYANLLAVMLTADQHILRLRLQARGRESQDEIDARLARNLQFHNSISAARALPAKSIFVIDNSGDIEHAIQALATLLQRAPQCDSLY